MNALLVSGVLLIASILSMPAARAVDRQMEDEERAAVELRQARQQIEAEDFLAAERLLEAARTRTPDDPDIHSLLGYCARRLGRLDESYARYQRALRLDPAHLGAHEYLGEFYLQRGELALARAQLVALERLCPEGCDERSELTDAIQAYRAVAEP
jgi:Flp pilus assembly protein TadD